MPWLATLLVSIFNALVNFFVVWFTKKTAIGLAAIAVFFTLTVGLWTIVGTSLHALTYALLDHPGFLMGLWVAVPSNAQACISATIAADTAIALYKWNNENLRLMAYIT